MSDRTRNTSPFSIVAMGFAAIAALMATFALANSGLAVDLKTKGFSGIVAVFLLFCAFIYIRVAAHARSAQPDDEAARRQQCLAALDEAGEYLAGSMNRSDVFKLTVNRVRQVLPLATAELLLLDSDRSHLMVTDIDGGRERLGAVISLSDAPGCFSTGTVQFNGHNAEVPLRNGEAVVGMLLLAFDQRLVEGDHPAFLEALAERLSPMLLKSQSGERSRMNALTDATTDLPNERAFQLILENQVAESQRENSHRPLTILAVDIKNFAKHNESYGHAAGDAILNFAAQTIKDSLRQMDFFARSTGDEFLIVLPTATKEVSHEIVTRIQTSFFGRRIKVAGEHTVEVELNFGWAAFGPDGHTPVQLLKAARVRKAEAKSSGSKKVVFFPREFVN